MCTCVYTVDLGGIPSCLGEAITCIHDPILHILVFLHATSHVQCGG